MILEANRIEVRSSFKAHPDRIIIPCESRKEAEKIKKQILYALKDYEIDYKGIVQKARTLLNRYAITDFKLTPRAVLKDLNKILGEKE